MKKLRIALIGAASAVLAGGIYLATQSAPFENKRQTSRSNAERRHDVSYVTYEDVMRNPDPELRQRYINEIVIKDPRLGPEFHEAVEKVLYDPQFAKYKEFVTAFLEKAEQTKNKRLKDVAEYKLQELEREKETGTKLYATTITEDMTIFKGKESAIYVSELPFEGAAINSGEDFVSLISHEGNHAHIMKKGIPFTDEASKLLLAETGGVHALPESLSEHEVLLDIMEAFAYGWQLRDALEGKYKLSPACQHFTENSYKKYYAKLKGIAEKGSGIEAKVAQAAIIGLPLHPK